MRLSLINYFISVFVFFISFQIYGQSRPYLVTKDGEKIEFSSITRIIQGVKADSSVYKVKELNEIVFGEEGITKRKHVIRCKLKSGLFKCKSVTFGEGRFYSIVVKQGESMVLKQTSYVSETGVTGAYVPGANAGVGGYNGAGGTNKGGGSYSTRYFLIKNGVIEPKAVGTYLRSPRFNRFIRDNFGENKCLESAFEKHKNTYFHVRALRKAYLGNCL